ncbi:SusE domain-containing protein [Dysgonomonas reticulitermitis]
MKKIISGVLLLAAMVSCTKEYDLNVDFTAPTTLNGIEAVDLDLTSTDKIILSWSGGGAVDGTYVLYEVLFDQANGDFSDPFYTVAADLGSVSKLTLTHTQLNVIARNGGIKPEETGTLKWTVKASKGGDIKLVNPAKTIRLTRGAGISVIPNQLYLYGSATENSGAGGQEFRQESQGVFVIYTKLEQNGVIYFRDGTGLEATNYYIDANDSKLKEAEGETNVTSTANPVRIVIDFNTLTMSQNAVELIKIIWADTWLDIDPDHTGFIYDGNGEFRLADQLLTIRHQHPAWGAQWSTDERYYFQTYVGGTWYHWRRKGLNDGNPSPDEAPAFFQIEDNAVWNSEQWTGAWKFGSFVFDRRCDIVIHTNKDGIMYHSVVVL